ncbi:MAG: hypothetical protein A2Y17_00875 [Clostridiales bacterium GWF2_38_85]|nr:MAG: hypothetical protein A2Y17_00875 [Clostridiales bacterium GWF2_38_85]HBL84554.1 hypothetical protein [Clostridiales bacterium]
MLACKLLTIIKDSKIADFMEISLFNVVMDTFSPSGRWFTYSTPSFYRLGTNGAVYRTRIRTAGE